MRNPSERDQPKAIDALINGLVDYAGLFPPAGEGMRTALENYSSYLYGDDCAALGRFIVPVSRLGELEQQGADLLPRDSGKRPWALSVLLPGDAAESLADVLDFNHRHLMPESGRAVIDVVELKASAPAEIVHQSATIPKSLTAYFEIPVSGDVGSMVDAIAGVGRCAKIRTGGVTPDAFPPPESVIVFIAECLRARVPFKATAGLHHPLKGEYRLTYEVGSPTWTMYGYLNVFLAAAFLHTGQSEEMALQVLGETDPASFVFRDHSFAWRDLRLSTAQIRAAREFAISFGSCSFREPIGELAGLTRTTTNANQ
jgi:hypothetical protein